MLHVNLPFTVFFVVLHKLHGQCMQILRSSCIAHANRTENKKIAKVRFTKAPPKLEFKWYYGIFHFASLQITASHWSNDQQILNFDGLKLGLVCHSLFLFSFFWPTRLVSWPAKPGPCLVKWPPYRQKLFAGLLWPIRAPLKVLQCFE